MDDDTRRHIREAEWERMRAREDRLHFQAQRNAAEQRGYDKRAAYVLKYGRQRAALRTLVKWTVAFFAMAMINFPQTLREDGIGEALLGLFIGPTMGFLIGLYRAAHLPNVE